MLNLSLLLRDVLDSAMVLNEAQASLRTVPVN
jgi:hypothetical protein